MAILYDLIDLAEITAFVRALEFDDLTLGRWLPNVTVDRRRYRFATNDRSPGNAVRFMAWDAETPIGSRPGISTREGALPKLGEKAVLSESEFIRREMLADVLPEPLVGSLYADAARQVRGALQTLELAKGEALSTGAVTVSDGLDFNITVDFGVPGAQMDVAPVGALWTTANLATAVPLTDLIAWRDVYVANTGQQPGVLVMSQARVSVLQRTAQIINAVRGSAMGATRVNKAELDELLVSEGLPPITVYDAQYRNQSGTLTRAIAADRVLFLPDGSAGLGETQIGRTVESEMLSNSGQFDVTAAGGLPGFVTLVNEEYDPPTYWIKTVGVGMPVLTAPELVFSADVA